MTIHILVEMSYCLIDALFFSCVLHPPWVRLASLFAKESEQQRNKKSNKILPLVHDSSSNSYKVTKESEKKYKLGVSTSQNKGYGFNVDKVD